MDPENSEGEAGKLASDLDLPIILRIGHILVMNGSEADGDLEYGPPVYGPPLWTKSMDLYVDPVHGLPPWATLNLCG